MAEYTFHTRQPIPETTDKLHERIRELTAIKDELDTELALLLGQKPKYDVGTPWHCLRCDHSWLSKLPHKPRLCPQCKSQKFNVPPAFTYEERLARRKPLKGKLRAAQQLPKPWNPDVESFDVALQRQHDYRIQQNRQESPLPHSVMTRTDVPMIIPPADDIQSIALAPPPQAPMSLRERLAQMKTLGDKDIATAVRTAVDKTISDDELVQAINGDTDAT